MDNIMEWLDKEQEHKLQLEEERRHDQRFNKEKSLKLAIAKQDIEFVKLRNKGVKGLHPVMLKKLCNVV
jgi:hypothetical protein